jgi:integrase
VNKLPACALQILGTSQEHSLALHTERTRKGPLPLASITRLSSGSWRAQIRRKGRYVASSFRRKSDAESWALEMERRADQGRMLSKRSPKALKTLGDLIDIHIADMAEVGKPLRRSKAFSLKLLKSRLGGTRVDALNQDILIEYGRGRAKEGAGPVTLSSDFSYLGTIILHAAAVHGVDIRKEPVDLARVALTRLGLIGKSQERDRRPTEDEIDRLIAHFEASPLVTMPMGRIVRFAVASAMRLDEICRIAWEDVNVRTRTVTIKDRKDPRRKDGNHQRVPLIALTGYDAWALLEEQRASLKSSGRIFPYNSKSVGTAFRRACRTLKIEDLHFHDLRHEATSRLFEAGLTIERVALVTGHRDWKMLRRYTHLKPESLTIGEPRIVRPPASPPDARHA